jgi:hypothetical protein
MYLKADCESISTKNPPEVGLFFRVWYIQHLNFFSKAVLVPVD